jgi:hypothetical protein
MVGVRYRRSLFPGFSDTAEYSFRCPGNAEADSQATTGEKSFEFDLSRARPGTLRVKARLLYRKIDQYLLNFLFGEESGLTTPVTEMASAETAIRLVGRPAGAVPAQ